ncbi:MAG: OmpH family outer membrane protein [Pelagibacterales bacterium]|nr:OmpH family outer membrane protein [Pelagibacterales bacterium]
MKIQSKNKLYKLLKFICLYMFFSNMVIAQEEVAEDNVPIIDTAFPIAVVNMQAIVGQSLAAVKVKEFIENKKVEFTTEIQKEEQELKSMQEELGSQRSILPPDEFAELEGNFRKRVENLQKMVAEKNQLLEDILSKSVQIIQNEAIKIITEIGKEKNLALTLDTSSVVIAANSINISRNVITLLNINLPTLNMNEIMLDSK